MISHRPLALLFIKWSNKRENGPRTNTYEISRDVENLPQEWHVEPPNHYVIPRYSHTYNGELHFLSGMDPIHLHGKLREESKAKDMNKRLDKTIYRQQSQNVTNDKIFGNSSRESGGFHAANCAQSTASMAPYPITSVSWSPNRGSGKLLLKSVDGFR